MKHEDNKHTIAKIYGLCVINQTNNLNKYDKAQYEMTLTYLINKNIELIE